MPDSTFVISTKIDLNSYIQDAKKLNALIAKTKKDLEAGKPVRLGALKSELDKVTSSTKDYDKSIKDASKRVNEFEKNIDKGNKGLKGTSNAMQDVGRRVAVWGGLSAAIFGFLQNLKKAHELVIQLDTAMAELKKVLPTKSDFEFLGREAFEIAIEFGREPTEAFQILKRFGQAGLEAEDALKATRTAMLALNTTGAETEQAINAIIGASRIFNIEFDNMFSVIDKVQRLQADFAVDAKDLIVAITAIGPAITVLGGDINDLFATVAATAEAARISGKEAANSLKRVFSRIVTKEGIRALQDMRIAVRKNQTEFRNIFDILNDVNKAFKTASDVEKQHLAITLAQVRQYPKFQALLGNFTRAIEAQAKSQNAFNDATRANELVLATYQNRMNRATASANKFTKVIVERSFTDRFVNLKTLFGLVGESAGFFDNSLTNLVSGLVTVKLAMFAARKALLGFNVEINAAAKGTKTLKLLQLGMAGNLGKVSDKLGANISKLSAFSSAIFPIIGLLFVLSPLIVKLWKHIKRGDIILKKITKNVQDFKDSLKNVDLAGIASTDVNLKYTKINNKLKELNTLLSESKITTKEAAITFAEFTTNLPFKEIDTEQLTKVLSLIDRLAGAYGKIFEQVIGTAVGPTMAEFRSNFDEITNFMRETGEISGEEFVKNFVKILRKSDFLTSKIQTEFFESLSFEDIMFKTTLGSLNTFNELNKAITTGLTKRAKYIAFLIQKYQKLGDTIVKSREEQEKLNLIGPVFIEGLNEQEKTLDELANELLSTIDTQKLFEKAYKAAGIAMEKFGLKAPTNEIATMNAAIDRAAEIVENKLLDALLKNNVALAEATQIVKTLGQEVRQIAKGGGSLFLKEFNVTALTSAIKRSSTAILVGYKDQILAIKQVGEATKGLIGLYDTTTEGLKATDAAIQGIIGRHRENARQLTSLQMQARGVQEVLDFAKVNKDMEFFKEVTTQARNSLISISTKMVVMKELTKRENVFFEERLKILTEIKGLYETELAQRKMIEASLKLQVDSTKSLMLQRTKLANLSAFTSEKILNDNKKIYKKVLNRELEFAQSKGIEKLSKKMLDSELKNAQIMGERLKKRQSEIDLQKSSLIIAYAQEELNRQITFNINRANEILSVTEQKVIGIKGAFESILSDTDTWMKELEEGKPLNALKRLLDEISNVVIEADAELIAEAIGRPFSNFIFKTQEETQEVIDALKAPELSLSIKDNIVGGGSIAGDLMKNSIVLGAADAAQLMATQLNLFIDKIFTPALIGNLIDKIDEITKTGKGLTEGDKKEKIDKALDDLGKLTEHMLNSTMNVEDIQKKTQDEIKEIKNNLEKANNISQAILDKTGTQTDAATETAEAQGAALKAIEKKRTWEALGRVVSAFVGRALAVEVAKSGKRETNLISPFSTIGMLAGSLAGAAGGPIGGFIGAMIGGLVGKKKDEEQVEELRKIEKNTAQLVDRLSPQIFNAPAGFVLPPGQGFGTSVNIVNNINVTGSSLPSDITERLTEQINDIYNRSTVTNSFLE